MFSEQFARMGRKIHFARFVSFVGSAFTELAIPLFLYRESGNATHLGLQWTFIALTKVTAGYLAPRLKIFRNDRVALYRLDTALAVATLLPLVLLRLNVVLGCYLATVAIAFLTTIQGGYIDSFVGAVARAEPKAESARAWLIAKIENGRHLGMMLGYMLAFVVSSRLGFGAAFVIDALSFLVSALLIRSVPLDGSVGDPHASTPGSYSILWRPELRWLTVSQLLAGFGLFIYNALHVIVMKQELHASDAQISFLYMLQYVGYFVGSRLPSWWVERTHHPLSNRSTVLFRWSVVGIYVGFALASSPLAFMLANMLLSFVIGVSWPGAIALFQRAVQPHELRAVGSARLAATSVAGAVGSAMASFLIRDLSSGRIFMVGAVIYVISGAVLTLYCRQLKLAKL